jgi:hypothetical protein
MYKNVSCWCGRRVVVLEDAIDFRREQKWLKVACDPPNTSWFSSRPLFSTHHTNFCPSIGFTMGWIPFWSSDSSNSNATKNLDPSLRDFLDKHQPKHSQATTQETETETPWLSQSSAAPTPIPKPESGSESQSSESKPVVPPQSLFQDGRYAHIWKNYKPLHVIEDAQRTDQDKLRDLVEERDARKAELGRIALENCVFEHLAQEDCWRNGSVHDMATLCSAQKREFNRCYKMQAKFMKALGFMNAVGDVEKEERIQMHADKLYRQMLIQEKTMEEAKERGEPEPAFENPLSPEKLGNALMVPPSAKSTDDSLPYSRIPAHAREKFLKDIDGMSPQEAAVEEASFLAELELQRQTAVKGVRYLNEEAIARQKRFESGQATIGDRAKRWWGGAAGMEPIPDLEESFRKAERNNIETKKN